MKYNVNNMKYKNMNEHKRSSVGECGHCEHKSLMAVAGVILIMMLFMSVMMFVSILGDRDLSRDGFGMMDRGDFENMINVRDRISGNSSQTAMGSVEVGDRNGMMGEWTAVEVTNLDDIVMQILSPATKDKYLATSVPVNYSRAHFGMNDVNIAPDGLSEGVFVYLSKDLGTEGNLETNLPFYILVEGRPALGSADIGLIETWYGPFSGKIMKMIQ